MADLSLCLRAITGLDALPTSVFRQLLDLHAAGLRRAGLEPEQLRVPMALWEHRELLPLDLVDAIHSIHDMSDDAGYDQLLAAAGGPLFVAEAGAMDAVTFATRTLLERPELFSRTLGRRFVAALRQFREFPGRLVVVPRLDEDRLALAQSRLGAFFKPRGRSKHCKIRWWAERDRLNFMVSHGRCYRVDDGIQETDDGCRETLVPWRPLQHDLVVYDIRTGRLSVSARDAPTITQYVGCFGDVLFGDVDWFDSGTVVTLDPLTLDPEEALRPTRGLIGVRLVELEVTSRTQSAGWCTVGGEDVFRVLREMCLDPVANGTLRAAKFKLQFYSDKKWRVVSIGVPDRVTGDWRKDGGIVRRYLEERGFLAGPPPEAACRAA